MIQQTPPQGFGWFGNQQRNPYQNQFGNPAFPNLPPLFLPNFAPPVYYPNTLPFPNYNPFPTPLAPDHNQGNGAHAPHNHGTENGHENTNPESVGVYPINNVPGSQIPSSVPHQHQHFGVFPGNSNGFQNNNNNQPPYQGHNANGGNGLHTHHKDPNTQHTHHHGQDQNIQHTHHNGQDQNTQHTHHNEQDQNTQHTNRIDSNGSEFATNAFFKPTDIDRRWTQEDEKEWQATTKAPYFENKVPGLACVLPASAVLGEKLFLAKSFLNEI